MVVLFYLDLPADDLNEGEVKEYQHLLSEKKWHLLFQIILFQNLPEARKRQGATLTGCQHLAQALKQHRQMTSSGTDR